MRRYKDGSRVIFCNFPELIKYFYEESHYPFTWYDNDTSIDIYQSGWELYPVRHLYSTKQEVIISQDLNKFFNFQHSITYLQKQKDFLDIYHFLSEKDSIYRYSQHFFKHFIFYFKEQACRFLSVSSSDRIKIPVRQDAEETGEWSELERNFLESVEIKRYYLDGDLEKKYLTKREVDCLNWCLQGKTAEEISLILKIEKRTAENHLSNIKTKLNCYKQSRLLSTAIKQGVCSI